MFSRLKKKKKHTAAGSSAPTAQLDNVNTNPMFGHAAKSTSGLRNTALSVEMETTALPAPAPDTRIALPSEATLPAGWTAHATEDGTPYYHNRATNETRWASPRVVHGEQGESRD